MTKWQEQQLKEIMLQGNCPKALDCDECVIDKVCIHIRTNFDDVVDVLNIRSRRKKVAENHYKLFKIQEMRKEWEEEKK